MKILNSRFNLNLNNIRFEFQRIIVSFIKKKIKFYLMKDNNKEILINQQEKNLFINLFRFL